MTNKFLSCKEVSGRQRHWYIRGGATLLLLATTCYHLYICLTIFKRIEIYLKKSWKFHATV